jgi:glycosyltransferase involved in cell wall biosynthesis
VHSIKTIPYATLPSFVASKLKHKKIVLDWDDWEGKKGLGRFMPFPFGEIHTVFERWIPYNVDGVIVRGPDDVEGAARAIEELVKNPSKRDLMSTNAREKAKKFLMSKLMEELLSKVKSILK